MRRTGPNMYKKMSARSNERRHTKLLIALMSIKTTAAPPKNKAFGNLFHTLGIF